MDIVLYVVAIVFFVQAKKLKDPYGNYLPEGIKKKKTATVCLIIAIVIDVITFFIGFAGAL